MSTFRLALVAWALTLLLAVGVSRADMNFTIVNAVHHSAGTPTSFNPANCNGGITLSGANLVAAAHTSADIACFTNNSHGSGKVVFKVVANVLANGNPAIGVATTSGGSTATYLGSTLDSLGWEANSSLFLNNTNLNSGALLDAYAAGDTLCVAIDLGAKLFWGEDNTTGIPGWNAGGGNPDLGTGGISISALSNFTVWAGVSTATNLDQFTYVPADTCSLTTFAAF